MFDLHEAAPDAASLTQWGASTKIQLLFSSQSQREQGLRAKMRTGFPARPMI
jgi:hypothetical protein